MEHANRRNAPWREAMTDNVAAAIKKKRLEDMKQIVKENGGSDWLVKFVEDGYDFFASQWDEGRAGFFSPSISSLSK
jgi:hypothetical protein